MNKIRPLLLTKETFIGQFEFKDMNILLESYEFWKY